MNNITFVTAYYNLREKENNPYRFKDEGFCTHDWYLNSFKKLLVKDVNLIIFTENRYKDYVLEQRQDKLDKTLIICKEIEELRLWDKYQKFIDNDKRYHISNYCTKKFTPLFYLIVNSKVDFVEESINLNHFNTDYFSWIDVRGLDASPVTDDFFYDIHKYKSLDKLRITVMSYTPNFWINQKHNYYSHFRGNIAGGFFIGHKDVLLQFIKYVHQELDWVLENGFAVTEEMIFGMVFAQHRDIFDPYYGDYGSVIKNLDGIHEYLYLALSSLEVAYNENNHTYVNHITRTIRDSHNKGFITLENHMIVDIWNKNYMSLYYLGNHNEGCNIIIDLMEKSKTNENVRNILKNSKDYYKNNFSYLNNEIINNWINKIDF